MRHLFRFTTWLDRRLRRYEWYLRRIDEGPNPALEEFRRQWAKQADEAEDRLKIRHGLIIKRLQDDREERRAALQSVNQVASVTLAAVSVVGLVVALFTGAITINTVAVKIALVLLAILLWLLVGSYMPGLFKALMPFHDAGTHVVTYAVPYTSKEEVYPGEQSLRRYAESIIYELNVRNRILTRARLQLAGAHKVIQVIVVVALALLLR